MWNGKMIARAEARRRRWARERAEELLRGVIQTNCRRRGVAGEGIKTWVGVK
jgi:hypothetical protein